MNNPNGQLRVLICTNADGMGVNYSELYYVVLYGPPKEIDTFVQQMGRAWRDNKQSHDLIIFKSAQLKRVDNEMKNLAVYDKCRRLLLTKSYMCDPAKDIKNIFVVTFVSVIVNVERNYALLLIQTLKVK